MTAPRLVALACAALMAAPATAQDYVGFRTPSGNIHCAMFDVGVRCDILETGAAMPSRPADCELDWGHSFGVGLAGEAMRLCVGDTIADPANRELGYGQSFGIGAVICTSEPTGLTCRNAAGHGFSLSRAAQHLF